MTYEFLMFFFKILLYCTLDLISGRTILIALVAFSVSFEVHYPIYIYIYINVAICGYTAE